MKVKAWRETVVIPTYEVGEPEKILFFLKKEFIRDHRVWSIRIL